MPCSLKNLFDVKYVDVILSLATELFKPATESKIKINKKLVSDIYDWFKKEIINDFINICHNFDEPHVLPNFRTAHQDGSPEAQGKGELIQIILHRSAEKLFTEFAHLSSNRHP